MELEDKHVDVEVRAWSPEAHGLLAALASEPWLDFSPQRLGDGSFAGPGRRVFVAWAQGQPRGLAILDEGFGALELTLAVDPAQRRRGIARALLQRARAFAAERALGLWADVEAGNDAARAFFTAAGAREESVTRGACRGGTRFVF